MDQDQRGQGLLELVIALGILLSGLSVVLAVALANTVFDREAAARAVAANLAREGIEVVLHIRFSNINLGALRSGWDDGLAAGSYAAVFDPAANAPLSWRLLPVGDINDPAAEFQFQSSAADARFGLRLQGVVTTGTPIPTGFRRLISIADLCAAGITSCQTAGDPNKIGIRVTSRVQWSAGSRKSVVVEETMFHWQ